MVDKDGGGADDANIGIELEDDAGRDGTDDAGAGGKNDAGAGAGGNVDDDCDRDGIVGDANAGTKDDGNGDGKVDANDWAGMKDNASEGGVKEGVDKVNSGA